MPKPPGANGHSNGSGATPTVPLKVYRELSAELQATKAMLDSQNGQNQQLLQQNQQLRQEIERLVQSALNLQQIVTASPVNRDAPTEAARLNAEALAAQIRPSRAGMGDRPPSAAAPSPQSFFSDPDLKPTHTEEPGISPRTSRAATPRDLNGIWLWLTVIAIIATAFAAGFVLVKPLLPSNNN